MLGVVIIICLVAGVFFYFKKNSNTAEETKADKDFEDNFLNGATGDDIDDFGK